MLALAILLAGDLTWARRWIGVRKARAEGRTAASAAACWADSIIGAILLSWVAGSAGFQRGVGTEGLGASSTPSGFVDWGGGIWPAGEFRALAVALFAAWAVVGAWRLMRLELQMQNQPWSGRPS